MGHNVLAISDRDIISRSKSINDFDGKKTLQKTIIDTYGNFKADCIILGHADSVDSETLYKLKNLNKNLRVTQWFLDPLGKYGPDYIKNNERINKHGNLLDSTFVTTDPNYITKKINNSFYIPNPSDQSFEILKNYESDCENDLFFAMSHGVHRGSLKKGKFDNREVFIKKLMKKNKNIKFDLYGMNNVQPVWGDNFLKQISNSSMGLNLSRGKPIKYYSSDRIAQLFGNGLLTFIDEEISFNDFIPENCFINYNNINDLSYKLNKYQKDKVERKKISQSGQKFYLKYLNSTLVADFILSKTFDYKSKNTFVWDK